MQRFSSWILFLAFATTVGAQAPDFGGKKQAEKMKELVFLIGEWEGSAYYMRGEQKVTVTSSEKVEVKAGGTALFVTGIHWMMRGDQKFVVHDAAAMICWDEKSKSHRMVAQLGSGARSEFELHVQGNGYKWEAPSPMGGTMRYVMVLTDAGEWLETGEQSTDGKTWTKAFEMRLKKKSG